MDQEEAADMVANLVLRSRTKVKGVDYRAAQVYLASNLDCDQIKAEGLKGLLPGRLHKYGRRPGPTTDELGRKSKATWGVKSPAHHSTTPQVSQDGTQENSGEGLGTTKWRASNPERDLTKDQLRYLLAKVLKVAILSVFRNHMYMFMGIVYIQLAGGPIGLRLTSMVARVVMDHWAAMFLCALQDSGIKIWAMMKYVDDVNVVLDIVVPGWRWMEGSMQWNENWMLDDEESEETGEVRTMKIVKDAAEINCRMVGIYNGPPLNA